MAETEIKVGDRIRCSVALLRQLYELPEHRSFLVEVSDVLVRDDGSKELVLNRLDMESLQ